jgi:hypothetical protein
MGVAKVIVPSRAPEVLKFNAAWWRTEANSTAGFCHCFDSDFDTCHRLTVAGLVNTSAPSGLMPLPLTRLAGPATTIICRNAALRDPTNRLTQVMNLGGVNC